MKTKSRKLGTYWMGWGYVEVWVNPNDMDGSFESPNIHGGLQVMVIGLANPDYGQVLGLVVHEAMEATMCDIGVRFSKAPTYIETCSDSYHFMMNHNEFSEAAARVGHFINHLQVDLMKAHVKHHKKK